MSEVRIAGVPLKIRPSFIALGLLATTSVAPNLQADVPHLSSFTASVLGAVVAAGLLLSVLLHEVAHAVVGRRLGMPVEGIELTLLGGATALGGEPASARDQYLVSVSGPVINLLLGGIFGVVAGLTARNTALNVIAALLCVVNTLLAAYNLLPGLPLDGGQLVRAGVWQLTGDKTQGLRAAGVGGLITAAATFVGGYVEITRGQPFGGLITSLVAAFIGAQAYGAFTGAGVARRLPRIIAGRLARPAYVAASDLPLAEALRRAAAIGRSAVVLGTDGHPSAVLSDALLAAVPAPRRPWVSLSSVSRPVAEASYLDAGLAGADLVAAIGTDKSGEYVVMRDGHLVGVLRARDVARVLRGRAA